MPQAKQDQGAQQGDFSQAETPIMVASDVGKVGNEIGEGGDIMTEVREFESGQTVYLSIPTESGRRVGDSLEVFWFHEDGRSRRDDAKRIEGPFTVFELAATDAGAYNVEIDVNGKPIGLSHFVVR